MPLNQNASYGRAMLDALHLPTVGKIFVVMNSSDDNYDDIEQLFKADQTSTAGQVRFYNDLATAYAATDSNRHDVIILNSQNTHTLTSMLSVTGNRTHFVGLDWLLGCKRRYGMGTKVSLGVTTAATDLGAVSDTGVRNSYHGIKFISNNTKDESLYTFLDGGEYTYLENCEIYKSTDLDVTGAAELVCNGDSSHYKDCYIGSTANQITGAIIRPCVLVSGGTVATGKKLRDVTFEGCVFARKCGNVANRFIYGANASDVERFLWIKDCAFISNPLGAATPAVGIDFGAAQTQGGVLVDQNCSSMDVTVLGATGEGVYTLAPDSPTYATSGIAVAS